MKNLIIIFALLLSTACATTKNANTKSFKLVKAEKQSYVLGMQMPGGKSSGTTYSIFFEHKGAVEIEKVWINTNNIDFERVNTSENGTFRIRSTFYGGTKANQHPEVKEPITHEGTALIQYKENDEVKYFVVKEFKTYESTLGK